MKTYARHRCARQHVDERALLLCALPRAGWVHGHGPYGVIAWCGRATVTLHTSLAAALADEARIGAGTVGCGSHCKGKHETVLVDLTGDMVSSSIPSPHGHYVAPGETLARASRRPRETVATPSRGTHEPLTPAGCCAHGISLGGRCRRCDRTARQDTTTATDPTTAALANFDELEAGGHR